jgi:DNA-binding CsgD family transcriptional regulator
MAVDVPELSPYPEPPPRLTVLERSIVTLYVEGLSRREVAERLHYSHDHVKNTELRLQRRLGVRSRPQLVALLVRVGAV